MKIIDFICKSDPLSNKKEVCPCNFSSFMQVPWADVLVRSSVSCSPTRALRSRTGIFQCWSQHKPCSQLSDLPPAMTVYSKVLPHQWYIKLSVWFLSHFWWGDSTHLYLRGLFLFFTLPCIKSCHIFQVHWPTSPLWHKQLILRFCCWVS